jgi:hypothetical protein
VALTAGNYALTSNYAFPAGCSLQFGYNATLVAAQGATVSNVAVASAPPNSKIFTSGAGVTFFDNMTRANENPISNGGNWVAGGGYTAGVTVEAGQILSNKYEAVTSSAAKIAYALWTGTASQNNQCSKVQLGAMTGSGAAVAVVRGSTSTPAQYQLVVGVSTFEIAVITTGGIQTFISALPTADLNISPTDNFQLCAVGTTLTGYLNGGVRLVVTDATIASGFPGMEIAKTGRHLQTFSSVSGLVRV